MAAAISSHSSGLHGAYRSTDSGAIRPAAHEKVGGWQRRGGTFAGETADAALIRNPPK